LRHKAKNMLKTAFNRIDYDDELEKSLMRKYQNDGDEKTVESLVNMNLGLVYYVMEKYYRSQMGRFGNDMLSLGILGIMDAVRDCRQNDFSGFKSYKVFKIRGKITSFLKKEWKYSQLDEEFEISDTVGATQQRDAEAHEIWDEIIENNVLNENEIIVLRDKSQGYKESEIDKRRFDGRRITFFHTKQAKKKIKQYLTMREARGLAKLSK